MRIVFAGPHLSAVADLAVALQKLGYEVAALLPYDDSAKGRTRPTRVRIPVMVGSRQVMGEILQASGPENLPCYLVRPSEALPRGSAAWGVFSSQIAVELARRLIPSPDVLQLSGWETALAPAYIRQSNLPFRTVLELNGLTREGDFDGEDFFLTNLPTGFFSPGGVEFYGRLNFVKGGLLFANAFTVDGVSTLTALRTERATRELGAVIAEQSPKCAIMHRPANVSAWDPASDPFIARKFSADEPDNKSACRTALLRLLSPKTKTVGPVVLLHLTDEMSGEGDLPAILDRWLLDEGKLIVVTEGAVVSAALEAQAYRFPAQISILREPDEETLHRAIAGADFQVFPEAPTIGFASAAWRAMRYGAIPVARDHVGRRDIFDEATNDAGEGLAWFVDSPDALWDTLGLRAAAIHRTPAQLNAIRVRAMRRAAAINETSIAEAHVALYHQLGVA
jgi:starch synthase